MKNPSIFLFSLLVGYFVLPRFLGNSSDYMSQGMAMTLALLLFILAILIQNGYLL